MTGPFSKIVVDRKVEAAFRRRALAHLPSEYMEGIWGRIVGDAIYIHAFMPIAQRSKPDTVYYDAEDLDDQEDEAIAEQLEMIGTIHSHPDCLDAIFSEGDTRSVQESQEAIMGICAIIKNEGEKRRTCNIQYWPAPHPLRVVHGVRRKKK